MVGSLEIRPELLQPYGILHGGVLCTMVETVGSVGAALWYGDRGNVVGVSNSTDFIRASRTGTLDDRRHADPPRSNLAAVADGDHRRPHG